MAPPFGHASVCSEGSPLISSAAILPKTVVASPGGSSTSFTSIAGLDQQQHDSDQTSPVVTIKRKLGMQLLREFSDSFRSFMGHHTGSIGMLGSMAIAVNSLVGPAMLNLPALFSSAGIIPTIATICFISVLSALAALHIANTISKVPDNEDFRQEVEYSQAFSHFWGRPWFIVTQVCFFCCISCLNISSIVDTAQVVDTFLGHWMPGGTAALKIGSDSALYESTFAGATADRSSHEHTARLEWITWDYSSCSKHQLTNGDCLPFLEVQEDDPDVILITAGNIITTIVFLPLALMDLDENCSFQIGSLVILILTSVLFVVEFISSPTLSMDNITWWGNDWGDLFGVVMFNFALVIAIPAWLYEREPHVDVPTVIHGSSALSVVLYVSVGLLGCMAMPNVSSNMLESMMSGALGVWLQLGASVFAFCIIGLGIPLFSILTRLNLTGSQLCSEQVANRLAVFLPFAISWLLYGGDLVTKLLSWGGVIFTSIIAFIFPLLLALHVVKDYSDRKGSVSVYFGWLENDNHDGQIVALRVLLIFSILAVVAGIIGQMTHNEEKSLR